MSVASLENGNLTLNQLIVNNSQYAEASGYVPSSTTITSTKNSTTVSIPVLTATTEVITPEVGITNSTNPSLYVNLTCPTGNQLSIGTNPTNNTGTLICGSVDSSVNISSPLIGLDNSTPGGIGYVNLSCSSNNILSIGQGGGESASSGTLNCALYQGGIGNLNGGLELVDLEPYTQIGTTYQILNFVAQSTATYVISGTGSTILPILYSCAGLSVSGTTTTIVVYMYNIGTVPISAMVPFSVIAMN
jgi:hypothetical protein